jgi:hypothetical protein
MPEILNAGDIVDSEILLIPLINDNVELIKELSTQLGTNNFLVFGGGHGGVIAGYLANKFATDENLRANYNVFGWTSSPPLKYLRHVGVFKDKSIEFQEINAQFSNLIKANSIPNDDSNVKRLSGFFQHIRGKN